MLHQTLPGVPDAVEGARRWVGTAVRARYPHVSESVAVQVVGELVAKAVKHTPQGGNVEINLVERESGALVIEVKDPNIPPGLHGGDWGEISRVVPNFGTNTTEQGGHVAWCELPEVAA